MATTIKNDYVGDGTTTLYSFTFPYLEPSDVRVSVDGTDLVRTTEYTFANATTIEMTTAPIVGAEIQIYRVTDSTDLKWVFFPGSSIRASDLNDNFTQNLYVTQEAEDTSASSEADAKEAAASAAAAQAAAEQAQASADNAEGDAEAAAGLAESANTNSLAALSTAEEAQEDADGAIIKADQALSAVLDVIDYEVVQTVADIPTSPEDSQGVKVIDSTGIESFTPLTGVPSDFIGDPGIFVEIIYSTTTTSWIYSAYNANDPDDRYSGGRDALPKSGGTMTGDITFADTQEFPEIDLNSLPSLL